MKILKQSCHFKILIILVDISILLQLYIFSLGRKYCENLSENLCSGILYLRYFFLILARSKTLQK